jgi:uncharacterized membrane protein (DUF485 family)
MTQKLALQIALMMLVSSCIVLVLLALNSGLGNPVAPDLGQVIPLAITCAAALLVIVANPFDESRA